MRVNAQVRPMKRGRSNTDNFNPAAVKKRRTTKRESATMQYARQIGAVSTKAPESKDISYTNQLLAPGTGSWTTPVLINGIAQGAGQNQRVGRKVDFTSLLIRFFSANNAVVERPEAGDPTAVGIAASPMRFIVFYDKQSNGAGPTIADLMSPDNINSVNRLLYSERFMILIDQYTNVGAGGEVAVNIAGKIFRKYNPGLQAIYGDATAGIESITSGSIWITMCSPIQAPTTLPYLNYVTRLRYIDA